MSWTTLGNGICPPPAPLGFRFVQVTSGQVNQAAIDNRGKLFTWGGSDHNGSSTGQTPIPVDGEDAFLMHPAINTSVSSLRDMQYPYQVGTGSDWVKVSASESTYVALDAFGSLYGWGASAYGITGIGVDEGYFYNNPLDKWERPGNTLIVPTLINADQWADFALGWYHILAQKADKSLWIWGTNLSNATYGTLTYADDYVSTTPIQMTWLPASPVRLFDADYSTNVIVTADNSVYAWGYYPWAVIQTPTLFPLSLPAGVTIVKCQCSWTGFGVLLSNGDIYCMGQYLAFIAAGAPAYGTPSALTLIPGGHNFVDFRIFSDGAIALDNQGNLWGWGRSSYLISQDDTACDLSAYLPGAEPLLTAATTINQRNWITMDIGGWTHCAIDNEGRLFTWGNNAYSELGVNLAQSELDHTCTVLQVADPTLDDGTLAYEDAALIGAGQAAILESPYSITPRQLLAHNPCGHWHIRDPRIILFEDIGLEFPENCWESTCAIDGNRVLYVVCGIFGPNQILLLDYNIATNKWTKLVQHDHIFACNWEIGAAVKGNVRVFHNYSYSSEGEPYQEVLSDPRWRTIVFSDSFGEQYVQHPTTIIEAPGRGKVAVNTAGCVALVAPYVDHYEMLVSPNGGYTYNLEYVLPISGTSIDARVVAADNGHFVLGVLNKALDQFQIHRSTDNGATWGSVGLPWPAGVADPADWEFTTDGTDIYACIYGTDTTRFHYSKDNGTTFREVNLGDPNIDFAASGNALYLVTDREDLRTNNFTNSVFGAPPLEVLELQEYTTATVKTVTDHCTLRNHGGNCVYTHTSLGIDLPAGKIKTLLVATDVGKNWREIQTPLKYFETGLATFGSNDNPIWEFHRLTPDKY